MADPGFPRRGAHKEVRVPNLLITARKRSLGQGNIFALVCHSVHGGGAWSRGSAPEGWCLVLRGCLMERPPGRATAAGGTHPTGMHSCLAMFLP